MYLLKGRNVKSSDKVYNNYIAKLTNIIYRKFPRNLDFEKVNLAFISGIGADISNLRITENPDFGEEDFLSADNAQLRIKLLPILKGQIYVHKMIFEKPEVRVLRNAHGEFNFMDLFESNKGSKKEKSSMLDWLVVSRMALKDGQVLYQDEVFSNAPPFRF